MPCRNGAPIIRNLYCINYKLIQYFKTGSEADAAGVITNPDTFEKIGVGGFPGMFATYAIVDPKLRSRTDLQKACGVADLKKLPVFIKEHINKSFLVITTPM